MTPAAEPVLALRGVTKRFGPVNVLEGIDLELRAGERRALIGPNGAGKSTLFNLISGRVSPSAGTITLNGRNVTGKQPHQLNRMGLSRSFQITHIFGGLSLYDNVYMAVMARHGRRWSLARFGRSWSGIADEAMELLGQAQLRPVAHRLAGTLAYSDQRALEICMTVATGPTIILLDEPTAGMAQAEAANMVAFIGQMTVGRSLMMVEHDMDVVFGLADSISVLANGRIIATGTPEQIRGDPAVQEAYLGEAASEC